MLVGLWIQVSNVSFRMWWLKANLGKGHWWEVEVSLCPLLSEISSSLSFLGLAQFTFLGSRNSPTMQKAGLLPLTLALCRQSERRLWSRLFLPCYRPFLPLLLLPLTLWDSATPSCFCGSFIYRVVLEWDHVLFIPGWYDRRSSPRPSFIEIKLTWNIIFLLRAWHDDLIHVYIAKWSPQ